ncbi:MAG: serine/threonine protein phosphatase [Proteobacteria bacterium]|nr:MAG: serine/threonine protein phosphatase [Pseudomonadota bacterium]PIE18661.1 MAG: serine/threonine protein phosphatase [Pseudomonadota bacterium]
MIPTRTLHFESGSATHVNRRAGNEDNHTIDSELGLYVVADGMGGYEGGERASSIVVEVLRAFFRHNVDDPDATWPVALDRKLGFAANLLGAAIRLAHLEVCAQKRGRLARMGSTVVALAVRGEEVVAGHVGDSRLYRLRDGELKQLTRDHSLWAELAAAGRDCGQWADFPYRNVITRAVGMPEMEPELTPLAPRVDDVFVLCSDGLLDGLDEEALAAGLLDVASGERAPQLAADRLVQGAYDGGAKDNITAIVLRVVAAAGAAELGETGPKDGAEDTSTEDASASAQLSSSP